MYENWRQFLLYINSICVTSFNESRHAVSLTLNAMFLHYAMNDDLHFFLENDNSLREHDLLSCLDFHGPSIVFYSCLYMYIF